jgi:alkanesulfonate monooxygenase SsuD/methylene tetrahydromethanopterin reductase-like flavin-dependent oxidoreductase (luciferase family)
MGIDQRERIGRLTEGLELIKRLWTEDSVTHHGRYFQLDNAKASVRPKQSPRPPIWLGGDVEPAVRRAARIADAWCIAPTLSVRSMLDRLEVFRDERRQTGQPEDVSCPLIRECFVGRDAAHAATISRGPLLFKYRAYASWGQGKTAARDFDATFDDFAKGRFLIGEAGRVKDEILHYAEIARTDQILLRVQWPGLAHQEALGNIERIGRIIAALS